MTTDCSCPAKSEWQRIVGEGFVDSAMADLANHLDRCSACQATVESLLDSESTALVIAEELRQTLPPTSPACRQTLEGLKSMNPGRPFLSRGAMSDSEAELASPGASVFCPHCLERVHMEEAVGASPRRCPACGRAVGAAGQREVALPDYAMNAGKDSRPEVKEIQEYVHGLERRARREPQGKAISAPRFSREPPRGLVAARLRPGAAWKGFHRVRGTDVVPGQRDLSCLYSDTLRGDVPCLLEQELVV